MESVERLEQEGMLPAIYFIFSRNACDDAAQTCLDAGLRLTTGPERDRIREIVDEHLGGMDDRDLAVLGYGKFLAGLEYGIAAHHAGMVPPFKEAVEHCFIEGLVKVVFATETLAVGINMPARSVVIEKLTKFTGEHHTFLTPGDYTQLTGRAGRRGIDNVGYAVVLWSPFVPFDQVAALASSRSFHLRSAFRPTYNMAANLVRSYAADRAHHLLNLSFAQYQADREVVKLEARLERRQARAGRAARGGRQPLWRHRRVPAPHLAGRAPAGTEPAVTSRRRWAGCDPATSSCSRRGVAVTGVAILAVAHRKGGVRLRAITTKGVAVQLAAGRLRRASPPRRAHRAARRPTRPTARATSARWPGCWSGPSSTPARAGRGGPTPLVVMARATRWPTIRSPPTRTCGSG